MPGKDLYVGYATLLYQSLYSASRPSTGLVSANKMCLAMCCSSSMKTRVVQASSSPLPAQGKRKPHSPRSEEHTSELQSLMRISYAVFCLKKKLNHKKEAYVQQT